MTPRKKSDHDNPGGQSAHSPENSGSYNDVSHPGGVALRCQYCSHQSFRRSSLRLNDFTQILLMRYPVRCVRCGQRQMVSFTIAGISPPPSIRPQRTFETPTSKHWTEPASDNNAQQRPRNDS